MTCSPDPGTVRAQNPAGASSLSRAFEGISALRLKAPGRQRNLVLILPGVLPRYR